MPDHEVDRVHSPRHYDCARFMFGDRWSFGIECEVQDSDVAPWGSREPFGSFWLWIGGQVVGNTAVAEQLVHAFGPLDLVRLGSGNRRASDVRGSSCIDKLDFIIWRRFGDDEEFDIARWGNRDIRQLRQLDLARFEVLPRGYSPFQDGWEAALLEYDEQETFIWRESRGDVAETHEFSIPIGEFARVAGLAADWFKSFRIGRVETQDRVTSERPRVVERSEDRRFAGI